MSIGEKVRALAEQGVHASAIAIELGVSRQRVYQVAKKEGVALPKYHHPVYRLTNRQGLPKPRLLTGGVETQISSATVGSVSELLVAADLLARGWHVYMPVMHSRGHDVIATKGSAIVTVEVRSAHRNVSGKLIYAKKPECASSHFGLVVTGEKVWYEPELPG